MKKLFITILAVFLMAGVVGAQSLCCDAQPGIVTYTLEIDGGSPIEGLTFTEVADGGDTIHCIYDVSGMSIGEHTFRAIAVDTSGWESEWSVPFVARKPAPTASMKIKKN